MEKMEKMEKIEKMEKMKKNEKGMQIRNTERKNIEQRHCNQHKP